MLSVASFANWQNFFAQASIANCDVAIYKNITVGGYEVPTNASVRKDAIQSFKLKRRNSYVATKMPNDYLELKIKWQKLDLNTQTYLRTQGNIIKIFFCVENTWTLSYIPLLINKCTLDKSTFIATIECVSVFNGMTHKNDYFPSGTEIKTLPINITRAEGLQLSAVGGGRGLEAVNNGGSAWDNSMIARTLYTDSYDPNRKDHSLAKRNILNNFKRYNNSEDFSQITVYGIESGTASVVHSQQGSIETSSPHDVWYGAFEYDKQYLITNVTYSALDINGNIYTGTASTTFYSDKVVARMTDSADRHYTRVNFSFSGYEAKQAKPNDNDYYVLSPTAVEGSTQIATAQERIRGYFSYQEYVEFDCRFDPRFEPLDFINIKGIGWVAIEEMTLDFNGGFMGHIKGRLFSSNSAISSAPIIENLYYYLDQEGDLHYGFDVTNPNMFPLTLVIETSYDYSLVSEYPIGAQSTISLDESDLPDLFDLFYEKYYGDLMYDIYCWFKETDIYGASENTIILESDNQ